jgi:hypothetical protein
MRLRGQRSLFAHGEGSATFGLLDADAQVRKSKSRRHFFSRFRQKPSRNKGSNTPRSAGKRKDFWTTLMGPPGRRAAPKVPQKEVSRDAKASSSRPRPTNPTICRLSAAHNPAEKTIWKLCRQKRNLRQNSRHASDRRRRRFPVADFVPGGQQQFRHGDSSAACPLAGGPRPPGRPAEQDGLPPTTAPGPRGGPATGNAPRAGDGGTRDAFSAEGRRSPSPPSFQFRPKLPMKPRC